MSCIKYIKGDLFGAPTGSVLAHSCNCFGSWGAGVAAAFQKKYPTAYTTYRNHCQANSAQELLGTCLLIPTTDKDPGGGGNTIACLFTSGHYGKKVDPPEMILQSTQKAVQHMLEQINKDQEVHMPKINAGLFNVPWEDTAAVLEKTKHPFVIYEL